MGQSLRKLTSGREEDKENVIAGIIGSCYDKYFGGEKTKQDPQSSAHEPPKELNSADFYRAVCETVEEINRKLNSTQFSLPHTEKLMDVYKEHFNDKKKVDKEEFQKILQKVIIYSGLTGSGSKDAILCIFGIPLITWFIKQRVAPQAIPNDVFIPGVTSASVYILAKLNKI